MNLSSFEKPCRYTGGEINSIRKDSYIRFALCFPDTYEIGMSHTGIKILYQIINDLPYASAERAFAPWVDYERYLRENHISLMSLEAKRPLRDFDIVGFSLQYELSYTNVLNMLDLAGIPLRVSERIDSAGMQYGGYPIVMAGGPCAVNPEPLADFIDVFVIGDAEESIVEILSLFNEWKKIGADRLSILKGLSEIDGLYVPIFHDRTKKVKRRFIHCIDDAPYPTKPIVPFTSIIHDRVVVAISRGCTRGCRFCQAGIIYRPLRERSLERVMDIARESLNNTGYEEVSFTSLSAGDYTCLLPLIKTIRQWSSSERIAISLPSLRVSSVSEAVLKELKAVRKTGFTIAPEAGTERLRRVINKEFSNGDYEEAIQVIFKSGWENLKLYFMIGLPTERDEDIDGIIQMAEKALLVERKFNKRRLNINVGISAFVPKPHTPFQWLGQIRMDEIREKQSYLKAGLQRRNP